MPPDDAPVTITVPGTCGELIQGWYAPWAEPVLVSCPIAQYSRITVRLRPAPEIIVPNGRFKARQAARLFLDLVGRPDLGAHIQLTGDLLPGRGMASSTADIIGTIIGLAEALGRPISAPELARLACQIEPSDSTMFPGLAMLAYRGSGRARVLGPGPGLPLLLLDPGGTTDTLAYNARLDLAAMRRLAASTEAALQLLADGLARQDPAAVGAAATLSALSYQAVEANPLLPIVQTWAASTGALGVVRAHSGSVIGLLYPPGSYPVEPQRWLSSRFQGAIKLTCMIGPGAGNSPEPDRSCYRHMGEPMQWPPTRS
jgi:L-threonine kinase